VKNVEFSEEFVFIEIESPWILAAVTDKERVIQSPKRSGIERTQWSAGLARCSFTRVT